MQSCYVDLLLQEAQKNFKKSQGDKSGEPEMPGGATQREFRRHFNIGRNGQVPTQQTILNWVKNFRATASAQ